MAQIESCVQSVERLHYGSLTPWSQVRTFFHRMDYAIVVDLETGQRFKVQRRAGSRHADVQPLTKRDTMIMKASGLLPQTLMDAGPREIIGYFLTSLNEHDTHTLGMLMNGDIVPDELRVVDTIKRPLPITLAQPQGELLVEVPVKVGYYTQQGQDKTASWRFVLQRFAPWERWQITQIAIDE